MKMFNFLTGIGSIDFAKQFDQAVKNTDGVDAIDELGKDLSGAGYSGFKLALTIGFIMVTFALIIAGVKLAVSHNSRAREEAKQKILVAIIGGALLSGIITIILIIEGIANGFME